MIPRPNVRINAFDEPDVTRISNDAASGVNALIPPPDYPVDDYLPNPERIRSEILRTTPAYPDYYHPYSSVEPRYRYVTYKRYDDLPHHDPLYDPYYYGYPKYDYYHGVSQDVYRIPPGTSFEAAPLGNQTDPELFEVESVTGRGAPHQVRNTTTGERFVVEPPVVDGQGRDRRVIASTRHDRGRARGNDANARRVPKFNHAPPREAAKSTSSYTETSIHTRSGPHFMNGVDYLDVSTRSRILTWLNKSSDRPIRLRPINMGHVDAQTGEPLRFRRRPQQGNR